MKTHWLYKVWFAVIALSITAIAVQGQTEDEPRPRPDRESIGKSWEVMQAIKISYLEKNLNLTDEEADIFWPLYHEYERKKKNVFKDMLSEKPDPESIANLSDEEIKTLVMKKIAYDQELLDMEKAFYENLFKALPAQKIARYYHAEKNYKRHLIDRMPHDRRPGPDKPPRD